MKGHKEREHGMEVDQRKRKTNERERKKENNCMEKKKATCK